MSDIDNPKYSTIGLEKIINVVVNFVFDFRMLFVFLCVIITAFFSYHVAENSNKTDEIKNLTFVITSASIFIGIFYAVLNYEHNYIKAKADKKYAQLVQSYSAFREWHSPHMAENIKIAGTKSQFYLDHQQLIDEEKAKDFDDKLKEDPTARIALISIFNYFEFISIGLEDGIFDKDYTKKAFKDLFVNYFNKFSFYIRYRQNTDKANTWSSFEKLVKGWKD
ncbi:MAG: DUF4760 domain-containing protein [Chitinophagaceae bacterium]|jgi:hypothetical protein|nr:DUF4760 domain-containing protein [Chitinophagaceae bacterium]